MKHSLIVGAQEEFVESKVKADEEQEDVLGEGYSEEEPYEGEP